MTARHVCLLLWEVVLLSSCFLAASADLAVVIEGSSAMLDQNHVLTCSLTGHSDPSSLSLQYEWRAGEMTLQKSAMDQYTFFGGVVLLNAREYECRVFESGTALVPLAVGTISLRVIIPGFQMRFTPVENPLQPSRINYVGQNVSYKCQTLFPGQLLGLMADVQIFGPGGGLIAGSDGRVGVTDTQTIGGDFERDLYFVPLSEADTGEYRCTGTIAPVVENPLVTNGRGNFNLTISALMPTLAVEVLPVMGRFLDVAPYNTLTLACMAGVSVRGREAPVALVFQWLRAVGPALATPLPAENSTNGSLFGSSGISTLTVLTQEAGNHAYSCQVTLDVAPATDNISDTDTRSLDVIGSSPPLPPEDPTAPSNTLSQDSATIQWRVRALQYTPELYSVLYGTSETNLTSATAPVPSGDDITRVNFDFSVELEDLEVTTTYYYQVEAENTVGVALSALSSFTTTGLPPTPPRDLLPSRDATTPTTYVFSWTPPTDSRGALVEYELTCQPLQGEATPIIRNSESTVTMATIQNLLYKVSYDCSVRARNMAYSEPSNVVTFTVSETVPGVVNCSAAGRAGQGWNASSPQDEEEGVNVTVAWGPPASANGITLGYTLHFTSFNGEQLATANVSASSTSYTFTSLPLSKGVPYNVSIVAENSAGVSAEMCILTDFIDQLVSPVMGLLVTRSESGAEVVVQWGVPSLEEAMGFLDYLVSFQPVSGDGSGGMARTKREESSCSQSPCEVPVEVGGVTIVGLDPATEYTVSVQPTNQEGEFGDLVNTTLLGGGGGEGGFPLLSVIVGVVVGVLVLAVVLVLLLLVVVCCCRHQRVKEYSVPGEIKELELEKRQDYVNDTVLCEQHAPLYNHVAVKDRLNGVPIAQFTFHVQDMHASRDRKFELEYESLGNERLASCEIAQLNKAKNRFANIFPYDFSRVKLRVVDGSDYVNASYIDGYKQANAYIAAQGPMANTIGDFWRMIWEHKLTAVIMLTKVNEAGKKKCEQYWPEGVGDVVLQPNTSLQVTCKETMSFADYEIRKLQVVDVSSECNEVPLLVIQYHFLGWPDHGVPKFATSLIEFIRRVRQSCVSEQPMLVHCGAGVGRTGTYITLDAMLERMKETDDINVYEFVRNMRAKRVLMVQTQAQYMFIHDTLEELITCGETSIAAPDVRDVITSLSKVNSSTPAHLTFFEEQFQLLNKVSRVPTDSDLSDALQHYNERKNRYQDKIPYNNNRVKLRPTGPTGTEYINASYVDGYKHRNAYIAAQGPLETTVQEFWRMMWELKSKVIVMLCKTQEEEEGKEMSYQYWPEKVGEEMPMGKLMVTLKSEEVKKDYYVERKLEVKEPMADGSPGQGFVVTQFHYQHWPQHDRPPSSTGVIALIKSLDEAQRNTGNKPVTVMCNDGVGRTGSFICIHAMVERVNTENILDFFQFIKSSRVHRPSLVMELILSRSTIDSATMLWQTTWTL